MKTILVTGAGGFLGRHLCRLLEKEHSVVGVDFSNIEPVSGIEWKTVSGDDGLARIVHEVYPDTVIHAAFINRKPPEFTESQYLANIFDVNLPLFKALSQIDGKLLLVSSSSVYGNAEGKELIDETCSLMPVSIYGLAKSFQEMAAQYYSVANLKVCIARLFNLIGPGQNRGMLLPDWVSQALDVVDGKASELKIRHRKSSRDFVDVRDASMAISLMIQNFKSGEVFNVASGDVVSLMEISEEIEKLCPKPLKIVELEPNPSDSDTLIQRGSFDKIQSTYGWYPRIDWRHSLMDLWLSYRS